MFTENPQKSYHENPQILFSVGVEDSVPAHHPDRGGRAPRQRSLHLHLLKVIYYHKMPLPIRHVVHW